MGTSQLRRGLELAGRADRLAVSLDDASVAAAAGRSLYIVEGGAARIRLDTPAPIRDLKFTADGSMLLAAPYIVDLDTARVTVGPADFIPEALHRNLRLEAAAFTPGGELALLGALRAPPQVGSHLLLWCGKGGARAGFRSIPRPASCRALTAGDEWIIAGGRSLVAVNLRGRWSACIDLTDLDAVALALNPTEHRLAAAGANAFVDLLLSTSSSWAPVRRFKAHNGPVTAVAFHPLVDILATAGQDGFVRLWTIDGLLVSAMPLGTPVNALCFSRSGGRLYAATDSRLYMLTVE